MVKPKEYKNILIIKMSSLGDVFHALPCLYALRKTYPQARITWAVHPAFAGVLPGKPWLDEIYLVDRKRIKEWSYLRQLRRELHERHFDLVIDLQMIAKSALVSFLSGCSNRIGYNDAREGSFLVNRPIEGTHKDGQVIEQYLDVVRSVGCEVDRIEFPLRDFSKEMDTISALLEKEGVKGRYVVLVPGTRGEKKKWPVSSWGELARRLAEKKIYSVISGTPNEKDMGREIKKISPSTYTVDLIGRTSLLELMALEKKAALHISGDTGPLHIANAVHTPIIALYGPTLPNRSGPYGNPNGHSIIAKNPGAEDCRMDTISVDEVYDLAMKVLQ